MKVRPKYKQIIDLAQENLPGCHAETLRKKVERWNEYADIQDEFFSRPGHVTSEQKLHELAEKYKYSKSNISKIVYTL